MSDIMEGVRILEVAEHTFVPAASAILADWGAEVINVEDPQTLANGYIGETATADGTPYRLVTTPVQFGGSAAAPKRGSEFNEHCDEILTGLGYDEDKIIELKVAGVVA